jgi:hypothetical protein
MKSKELYKPLPEGLRIEKSKIQGYGLSTLSFIKKGTNLGTSHYKIKDELIRTPLGGFINHSDEPNCEKVKTFDTNIWLGYSKYNLVTIRDIKAWEELTLEYTFYKLK